MSEDSGIRKPNKGLFDTNLAALDDFIRAVSLNSPLIKMGLLGVPAYYAGKALAKPLTRMLSPQLDKLKGVKRDDMSAIDPWQYMSKEERESTASTMGSLLAAMVTIPTLINNLDFDKEWWGLKSFSPKDGIGKEGSALDYPIGMHDLFNPPTINTSQALGVIQTSPLLTQPTRTAAVDLINSLPPGVRVNHQDIVNTAVEQGKDALYGGALGFVTAKALGLPNPLVTAGIFAGINAFLK